MNVENILKFNIALSVISFLISWLMIYSIIPLLIITDTGFKSVAIDLRPSL